MKTVVLGAQVTVLLAFAPGLFPEKQKHAILHRSFYEKFGKIDGMFVFKSLKQVLTEQTLLLNQIEVLN